MAQVGCSSCQPTDSVKAMKTIWGTDSNQGKSPTDLILPLSTSGVLMEKVPLCSVMIYSSQWNYPQDTSTHHHINIYDREWIPLYKQNVYSVHKNMNSRQHKPFQKCFIHIHPLALLHLLLKHRARLANTSKIKIRVQTQTGYILGMLMATFSPRRSLMFRVSVLKSHNKQPQTIFYICHSLNQLTKQQQHSSARNCDVKTVIPESRVSLVCHFVGHKHRSGGSPVRRWLRLRNCRIRTS